MASEIKDSWIYSDGGQAAHRSLRSGYCAVRALVHATGMKWKDAEQHLRRFAIEGKARDGRLSSGMFKEDFSAALAALGWHWQSTTKIEENGRKRQPRPRDIADQGQVIASQARHFCFVDHGVVKDIWDSSEKMVYGYWKKI